MFRLVPPTVLELAYRTKILPSQVVFGSPPVNLDQAALEAKLARMHGTRPIENKFCKLESVEALNGTPKLDLVGTAVRRDAPSPNVLNVRSLPFQICFQIVYAGPRRKVVRQAMQLRPLRGTNTFHLLDKNCMRAPEASIGNSLRIWEQLF
jgi:hypothetical protein